MESSQHGLNEHEYKASLGISTRYQFYAMIAACMRKADGENIELLKSVFPKVFEDLERWRNTPVRWEE